MFRPMQAATRATSRTPDARPDALPVEIETRANAEAPSAQPAHLPFLDGLRALAALFVVLHHAWLHIWPPEFGQSPSGLTLRLTGWLKYGHFAVALFIVLSGYSLMLSVVRHNGTLKKGIGDFFYRRAKRILPPYYLSMLVSLALILTLIGAKTGTHWDCSLPVTTSGLISRLLLLQDIMGGGEINHVYWSISVEWHYYLLFPLLVWSWRKIGGWFTTCAVFIVSFVGTRLVHSSGLHEALFPFLTLFAFGMLGATICFDKRGKWPAVRDRVSWLPIAAIAGALTFRLLMTRLYMFSDYIFGVACLALLVGITRNTNNALRKALSWKPLTFIGGFSYSLYLIHAPLIQVFWQYAVRPLHLSALSQFLLLVVAGTPLFVGAAYLFYLVGERPFLQTKRNHAPRIAV